MQTGEKKLINIFKIFIDKAILPQIRKFEGSLAQWSKFSSLLLADNLNYVELQYFVDTLPIWGTTNNEKLQVLSKKLQADNTEPAFNPSKTFGGERNKIMYNLGEDKADPLDSRRQSQRDQSLRQRVNQNNLNILNNLEKLLKNLQENQNTIDALCKQIPNQTARISREPMIQYNAVQNPTNGFTSHSYNYIPTNQPQVLNSQNNSLSHPHSQSHSQPHSHSQSYTHTQPPTYLKNYY